MARKREGTVHESVSELEMLASRCAAESSRKARLQMLLMICRDPQAKNSEIARTINCSERTVRRWWNDYQEQGIDVLLSQSDELAPKRHAPPHRPVSALIPANVCEFLNSIPTTKDSVAWIEAVRAGLQRLLGDVDHITISVSVDDPDNSDECDIELHIMQNEPLRGKRTRSLDITTHRVDRAPGLLLIEQSPRNGIAVEKYHPPHYFDYHLDGAYVGTIILWREKGMRPISRQTLETMRQIERFLTFLFSDCAVRRQQSDPEMQVFNDVIEAIASRIGLSPRELDVFALQLHGRSYEQIARELKIDIKTVEKHVAKVHEKAGVRNYGQLIARFFTPLRDD
jgi:DNA-binding CsgD family transcriptional regulator